MAAVDAAGNGVELARVSQGVEPPARPKPRRGRARMLRLFQPLGLVDQVKGQRFAAHHVVGPAGDLDQATAPVLLAVAIRLWCVAQALGQCAGVVFAQVLVIAQFAHVAELARFVADLGDKGGDAFRADDLEADHRGV